MAELTEENFKLYYTDLVNAVLANSPTTKVICNSIYPVENDYQHIDQISNAKIDHGQRLDTRCGGGHGHQVHGLPAACLKAEDGSLREDYGNGDGLHLNADGYNAVLQYLRTHAYL